MLRVFCGRIGHINSQSPVTIRIVNAILPPLKPFSVPYSSSSCVLNAYGQFPSRHYSIEQF